MRVRACTAAVALAALGAGGCGDGGGSDSPAIAPRFAIVIGVTNAAGDLGALRFTVEYVGDSGDWVVSTGDSAQCAVEQPPADATFTDRGGGVLDADVASSAGIVTPGPVATCAFASNDSVTEENFVLTVLDASDPNGNPPAAAPVLAVEDVIGED
jgi:hypothetical protein